MVLRLGRRWLVLILLCTAVLGCRQERRFDDWKWKWPGASKKSTAATTQEEGGSRRSANVFQVWVIDLTGSGAGLDQAWSYLDEMLPGKVQNWPMVNRNGLRCGIGQVGDWPAVKKELDECGARVKSQTELNIRLFSPIVLLSDEFKEDRTVFFYDQVGRARGMDYGRSKLQFLLATVGRTGTGRTRVVFSPRIVQPVYPLQRYSAASNERGKARKTVKEEIEDFSVVVDLGPEEFVLVGPTSGALPDSVIGSQLFLRWEEGQRHTTMILVKPVETGGAERK